MGKTQSYRERRKQGKYRNSPCEKQCYFELLVVEVQEDQIERDLNYIL